jgi:N-acetylglucosaminyldiphosphoundecaprenol N-acetyl-beta-D-mannosaminyltransferase
MMFWSDHDEYQTRGVTVNVASRDGLLVDMEARLRSGAGFSVATLNLDHVVKLRKNAAFREAYLSQTHVTADGNPIVWLMRVAGREVDLVTGSDLVDPVAALAARLRVSVAMVGSTEPALAIAAQELSRRHPGFRTAATLSPPMGFDPEGKSADALIAEIGRSGARLCYVALGAPKQEVFAARARAALPEVGFLSIGAGLDFIAGSQRRAPPSSDVCGRMALAAGDGPWAAAGALRRLRGIAAGPDGRGAALPRQHAGKAGA